MSSRHRASRDPATGEWQVETWRLHERSNSGPITVRAYVEALPERTYTEVVETIAGSRGSDMAVFELEDGGEVHLFAMRCVLLKQMRGLATRYDRRPDNFFAAIKLAAIHIWIDA